MRRTVFTALLAASLVTGTLAEGRVTLLIETEPEGATIVYHGRELGITGKAFPVELKGLPREANTEFTLKRKDYKPYVLLVPTGNIKAHAGEQMKYPDTAIKLEAEHWWVPLKEHPERPIGLLAILGVLGALYKRNRHLRQSIDEREATEARLQAQIKDKHEFAFSLLGRYRILEQLGEGGIAKVYRAVPDDSLDESQAVAVKILHPHLCQEAGHRERFVREGRVSQQLIHPNIIRLFELETEGDVVYLVLELLDGETLKQRTGGAKLGQQQTFDILSQVISGLCYAHSQGVVHRDLTPSNIMLTRAGGVKLMDFGLARNREVGHTVTVTGVVQGTPGYMAPEQLTETLDARTDQYSLGVILFELLTGRRPIERSDPMQLIMATYTENAPDPREFEPDIPQPLAEFILKLLSRDPEDRFADMASAAEAFQAAFPH